MRGSDWPHTSFSADRAPDCASTPAPVREILGEGRLEALLHEAARRLYA